jgi:hypothetical protein
MITVICVICGLNHLEKKDVPKEQNNAIDLQKPEKFL